MMNQQANTREHAIRYLIDLRITIIDSVVLQATTLAQLTDIKSELTRKAIYFGVTKCEKLIEVLLSYSKQISIELLGMAVNPIFNIISNIIIGINSVLLDCSKVLQQDFIDTNRFSDDYDTDLEYVWSNPYIFANGNDFSKETIQSNRNLYYQEETALLIESKTQHILKTLINLISQHLNIGQKFQLDIESIGVTIEKTTVNDIIHKTIKQSNGAEIHLKNFEIDENKLFVTLSLTESIEIIIPRDKNLQLPTIILQNVTNITNNETYFHFNYFNITHHMNLSTSLHVEIQPNNKNLAYFTIIYFDNVSNLDINQIDEWKLFCPHDNEKDPYSLFFNNTRIKDHHMAVLGIRKDQKKVHFTDYSLRVFMSGCYYLDENNEWRADNLILMMTPLLDNKKSDKYFYEIIFFTGMRNDAATKSKVYFILSDNDNDTGLRLLDAEGSILERGNIDLFLMAVSSCLGPSNYLRIGHDNSGDSSDASWFLK
ncbi:unnamed protein product [Rotaria sp. Silwood1]|nr:unnamed protein product [Rotaria sp. Silwood1]